MESIMLDPVIYDLNRYLAEEAKWEAREECLEAIACEIRETTQRILLGENRHAAMETMQTISDHIPYGTVETLLLGVIRHEYSDIARLLLHIFEKAQSSYIDHEAREKLNHLEAIEAEDAALAGKI